MLNQVRQALREFHQRDGRLLHIENIDAEGHERVDTQTYCYRVEIRFVGEPESIVFRHEIPRIEMLRYPPNWRQSFNLSTIIRSEWAAIVADAEMAQQLESQRLAIHTLELAGAPATVIEHTRQCFERDREHARRHHNYDEEQTRLQELTLRRQMLAQEYEIQQRQLADQNFYSVYNNAQQGIQGLNSLSAYNGQFDPYSQQLYARALGLQGTQSYIRPEDTEAERKGLALLKENLTPAQIETHDQHKYFDVKGNHSGKTYRIKRGRQMNVYELDGNGNEKCGWCFVPAESSLCVSDTILCQKIALETDEKAALKVANKF